MSWLQVKELGLGPLYLADTVMRWGGQGGHQLPGTYAVRFCRQSSSRIVLQGLWQVQAVRSKNTQQLVKGWARMVKAPKDDGNDRVSYTSLFPEDHSLASPLVQVPATHPASEFSVLSP